MKKILAILLCSLAIVSTATAKGGMSSGGGHSSGGSSHSSGISSSGSKGSFSSAPHSSPSIAPSRPSAPAAAPAQAAPPRTTTTTTSTTSTTSRRTAGGGQMGGGMMYGGMGMGFGYTNGLLTGLIIGNMMHPHNTVVYAGGGSYNNNALLYPDGRVVNQQGYQVGTYNNGQFSAVNGGMVAQNAPSDAMGGSSYQSSTSQPIILQKAGPSAWEIAGMAVLSILCVLLFLFILGVF